MLTLSDEQIEKREGLIQQPDCDGICPPYVRTDGWCCRYCSASWKVFAQEGGYEFFTEEEKVLVKLQWIEVIGFRGAAGCRLPRKLRPQKCLDWKCKTWKPMSRKGYGLDRQSKLACCRTGRD